MVPIYLYIYFVRNRILSTITTSIMIRSTNWLFSYDGSFYFTPKNSLENFFKYDLISTLPISGKGSVLVMSCTDKWARQNGELLHRKQQKQIEIDCRYLRFVYVYHFVWFPRLFDAKIVTNYWYEWWKFQRKDLHNRHYYNYIANTNAYSTLLYNKLIICACSLRYKI